MNRRQFLKGAAGVLATIALPALVHPRDAVLEINGEKIEGFATDEPVVWKSKSPEEIFEDVERVIFNVKYDHLVGKHYSV